MRGSFLIDVFGFSLLVDHAWDRAPESARPMLAHPVPQVWLDAHPDHPAPLSRRAAEQVGLTNDEQFDAMVELRIRAVEALLGVSS